LTTDLWLTRWPTMPSTYCLPKSRTNGYLADNSSG